MKIFEKPVFISAWIYLILLPLLSIAYADSNFTFSRTESDRILIHGESCASMEAEVPSIRLWTQKVDKMLPEGPIPCHCSASDKCDMDLTEILPQFFKKDGFKPNLTGANCWNAALEATGILSHPRVSTGDEISFFLNSPLCRERLLSEEPQIGDMIVQRSMPDPTIKYVTIEGHGDPYAPEEVHAMIRISDHLVFQRAKPSMPYELKNYWSFKFLDERLNRKECERVFGHPPTDPHTKDCSIYQNYFTCQSMTEYFAEKGMAGEAKSHFDRFDQLECHHTQVDQAIVPSTKLFDWVRSNVDVVKKWGVGAQASAASPDERFIIDGILVRAKVISENLLRKQTPLLDSAKKYHGEISGKPDDSWAQNYDLIKREETFLEWYNRYLEMKRKEE